MPKGEEAIGRVRVAFLAPWHLLKLTGADRRRKEEAVDGRDSYQSGRMKSR